jgi:hypothetical protein
MEQQKRMVENIQGLAEIVYAIELLEYHDKNELSIGSL